MILRYVFTDWHPGSELHGARPLGPGQGALCLRPLHCPLFHKKQRESEEDEEATIDKRYIQYIQTFSSNPCCCCRLLNSAAHEGLLMLRAWQTAISVAHEEGLPLMTPATLGVWGTQTAPRLANEGRWGTVTVP